MAAWKGRGRHKRGLRRHDLGGDDTAGIVAEWRALFE
jgi:hypothetical protein